MALHSSTLAWKIPWREEPRRLQSMRSLRVGHDRGTSLSLFTFMHWRRTWQPTPVFLPGESQGWGSLVGCCLWGRTESDMTEATQRQHGIYYNALMYICTGKPKSLCDSAYCDTCITAVICIRTYNSTEVGLLHITQCVRVCILCVHSLV